MNSKATIKGKLIVSAFVFVLALGIVFYQRSQSNDQANSPNRSGSATDVRGVKQADAPKQDPATPIFEAATEEAAFTLNPGHSAGAITAKSTFADLQHEFGAAHVKKAQIDVGEGQTIPGVKIYEGDPTRALSIYFKEKTETPESVVVRVSYDKDYDALPAKSRWHTADGITLGTTLEELEKLNAGPFTLAGFGWDYGGTVITWGEGKLRDKYQKNGSLVLRLQPPDTAPGDQQDKVSGDGSFKSDNPAMQQINPYVYEIFVGL